MAPSGSGKTTLFRLIAGLDTQDSGSIIYPENDRVSVMFQEDRLLPSLTAFENINIVAKDENLTLDWLNKVGLKGFEDSLPSQLSGGMKRRVSLARAMVFTSGIILLDEPFKGLDVESSKEMQMLVSTYCKDKIAIMVTHSAQEAEDSSSFIFKGEGPPLKITEIITVK